jgi:hypothetical protein
MPILNYTTKIDYHKTIAEIIKLLSSKWASKIIIDNTDNLPTGITFQYEVQSNKFIAFSLPCNFTGVLKAMQSNKKVPASLCNEEQALRVGWRILKDWIHAQIAIVDAELASMSEVFLPYAVTRSGKTLFNQMSSEDYKALLP